MDLRSLAKLFGRHKVAVALGLLLAILVAVYVKEAPPMYQESGTFLFIEPNSPGSPNPYNSFSGNLVFTGYLMTRELNSLNPQQHLRQLGGTATYSVGMVNSYNLEYPAYDTPYATVTTTSQDPLAVQRTFALVARSLTNLLASSQANYRVKAPSRIVLRAVDDSGVVAVRGSSKRVFAGLLLLAVVGLFMSVRLLDRNNFHLGRGIRLRQLHMLRR